MAFLVADSELVRLAVLVDIGIAYFDLESAQFAAVLRAGRNKFQRVLVTQI